MARRSGLGKGLASLIPPAAAEAEDGEVALRDLPLTAIEPNPAQPRTQFDEESLGELTASWSASGSWVSCNPSWSARWRRGCSS